MDMVEHHYLDYQDMTCFQNCTLGLLLCDQAAPWNGKQSDHCCQWERVL